MNSQLDSLIHTVEFRAVAEAPLHVGGERGIRPSIIDLKVYRRLRYEGGKYVERITIPSSTLKGVLRHTFEDMVRQYVIGRLGLEETYNMIGYAIGAAVAGVEYLFGEEARNFIYRRIIGEQQIITVGLHRLYDDNSGIGLDINSVVEKIKCGIAEGYRYFYTEKGSTSMIGDDEAGRLALASALVFPSLIPLVCDPTTPSLTCISDTAILDLTQDRMNAFRTLLNVMLLRKTPIKIEMCPVCLLFGGMGRASPIRVNDLVSDQEGSGGSLLPTITRVSIDRYTLTARKGKLFVAEYVPPGFTFRGSIDIINPLLHPMYRDGNLASKIICMLLKSIERRGIGGMRSIGHGILSFELQDNCTSNNDPESLVKEVLTRYLSDSMSNNESSRILDEKIRGLIPGNDGVKASETLKIIFHLRQGFIDSNRIIDKLTR